MVVLVPPRNTLTTPPGVSEHSHPPATMKHILHPTRVYQKTPLTVKIAGSLSLILLFAGVIFAATRNWEPHRPLVTVLTDVSDIRAYLNAWAETKRPVPQAAAPVVQARNSVEQELLGKGTIRPAFQAEPTGLVHSALR